MDGKIESEVEKYTLSQYTFLRLQWSLNATRISIVALMMKRPSR
jgi:hypothetical protein